MKPASVRSLARLALLLSPVTIFLGIFFVGPLLVMLLYSFLAPGLYGGVEWTFYHHNYGRILGWADGEWEEFDPVYIEIFLRSCKLAITTVIFSLIVCYPAAFWVARLPDRWKSFLIFLITLPFFVSLIVRLYAWVLILRPTGFINQTLTGLGMIDAPLDLMFNESAVIIGMVYIMIPFMFLPIYASIEKLDAPLIEASQDLGAGRITTFRRIILPLTLPGVVGGSVIVFIPSLGNFIVPEMLGGAKVVMIGNLVEQQFLYARNWPFGAALAMMIMATVLAFLLVYVSVISRNEANAGLRA